MPIGGLGKRGFGGRPILELLIIRRVLVPPIYNYVCQVHARALSHSADTALLRMSPRLQSSRPSLPLHGIAVTSEARFNEAAFAVRPVLLQRLPYSFSFSFRPFCSQVISCHISSHDRLSCA